MSEEEKDPKPGEEKSPKDNGQPEKKPTDSEEEKVEISKSELQKLQKKSSDFDGIALRLKKKEQAGRTIPRAEPENKKEKSADENADDDDELEEEFVLKKDFQRQIEKSAIKEASKNPEVDENWDSIMEFYIPRHGKETIEDILADIDIAHKTWKAQNPSFEKSESKKDTGLKTAAELAKDSGLGKGKDKESKPERKSIIPKQEKMEDWYGDKK